MILFPATRNTDNFELVNLGDDQHLMYRNENYEKISYKQRLPVKFYVMEEQPDGKLCLDGISYNLQKAEVHGFKIKPSNSRKTKTKQNTSTLTGLYDAFGNKKAKASMDKRSTTQQPKTKVEFLYEEQILPKFNQTVKISEIYVLAEIFPNMDIVGLNKIEFNKFDLHENIQKFYDPDLKPQLFLIDCIYKTLEQKKINMFFLRKKLIKGGKIFAEFLASVLHDEILTDINRDRLIVLCYILILMVNNFSLNLKEVPRFGCDEEKIRQFLKTIGCNTAKKSQVAKLKKAPQVFTRQSKRGTRK